jgi:L-amino acid N-acyltransferase YncA
MAYDIRPAVAADAAEIAAIYAPVVEHGVASFEESPPDAAELRRRMLAEPRLPWLVAVDGDRIAGYAYASRHKPRAAYRWSADVSVYIGPDHHRRGVGRALYGRLIPEVRSLGYVSLFAGIALPNPASVGLHEAMGFRPLGVYRRVGFKHGGWRDVGWWQLVPDGVPVPPEEPRRWTAVGAPGT